MNDMTTTGTAPMLAEQSPADVMGLLHSALDKGHPVEVVEKLLGMQERIMATQARQAYNAAMHAVQGSVAPVVATGTNEHTRSKYAKFEGAWQQLRPLLNEHGFSVSFSQADGPEGMIRVLARVCHVSGHCEEHHLDLPPDSGGARGTANKSGVQAVGSTLSYAKRYLLFSIFGMAVAGEDDDGSGGGARTVTANEAANIRALLGECPPDTEANMLRWQKVGSVEDIPAAQYATIVRHLEKKRAQA